MNWIIPGALKNYGQLLQTFRGKKAEAFSRADFMFEGKEDQDHFGPLQITFDDNTVLVFELNDDGQSILISTEPLPFPVGIRDEVVWKEISLNGRPQWDEINEQKLIRTSLMVYGDLDEGEDWICGVRIDFENDHSLFYYNYSDDAVVSFGEDDTLKRFLEENKIKFVE